MNNNFISRKENTEGLLVAAIFFSTSFNAMLQIGD